MCKSRRRVAEWLVSRRLDLLGTAFALGSLVCGVMAAAGTAVAVNSAATAINAVAPKTASEFSSAEAGFAPMALFLACALIALSALVELIVLAFDGLGHRIRKDYEDLVDDVEQLESEAWVSVRCLCYSSVARLTRLHSLRQRCIPYTSACYAPLPSRSEAVRNNSDWRHAMQHPRLCPIRHNASALDKRSTPTSRPATLRRCSSRCPTP